MPEPEDFKDDASRFMEMPSGKRFYMSNPVWDWDDIAYTLAGQPRFNGTARRNAHGQTINVAEHSVRASYVVLQYGGTLLEAFEALIHDVPESILGDPPGPWKAFLPDYVKLETYLWESLTKWIAENEGIELPAKQSPLVKWADWKCLMIEAREVMPTQGRNWVAPSEDVRTTTQDAPMYWWEPEEAEARFHVRLVELLGHLSQT